MRRETVGRSQAVLRGGLHSYHRITCCAMLQVHVRIVQEEVLLQEIILSFLSTKLAHSSQPQPIIPIILSLSQQWSLPVLMSESGLREDRTVSVKSPL